MFSFALFTGCTSSVDFSLPSDEALKLSIPSNQTSCQINPGTPLHNSLAAWLAASRHGWKRNPATYVPRVVVAGRNFSMNFMESSVILNYTGGQFTHHIPAAQYAFLVCEARVGT